jgi:hypothetical protein
LVPLAPGNNSAAVELGAGRSRVVAERKIKIHACERAGGFLSVAGGSGGTTEPHQHVVGRSRHLRAREPLVDLDSCGMVAERLITFRFGQSCGLGHVSQDVSSAKRLKGAATLFGPAEAELGDAFVQLGVLT